MASIFSFAGLRENLTKLTSQPGPSRLVTHIGHFLLNTGEELPLYSTIRELIKELNRDEKANLRLQSHNGNLLIVGGFKYFAPSEKAIRKIPCAFTAHLDEITFLVSKVYDEGESSNRLIIPLCAPPRRILNNKVQIFGIRNRNFKLLGEGTFYCSSEAPIRSRDEAEIAKYRSGKDKLFYYINQLNLKPGHEIKEGDMVIYQPIVSTTSETIETKALDDRAGVIAIIYAMKELSKRGIKTKGILTCDEEGTAEDTAWARLVRGTFRKYCKPEDIIIICDGIDGLELAAEFPKDEHLDFPLIVPYTGHGKGGGDHVLFALLRDEIPQRVQRLGFKVETTTAYVSRSIDPKLMDEFPHICFIDWVNGKIGSENSICHIVESLPWKQLENLIATLFCTAKYISDTDKDSV